MANAKQREWEYDANEFTDQPPEELIVQSVRARLLDFFPQEIPYSLKSEIEYFSQENGNNDKANLNEIFMCINTAGYL